MRVDAHQHYWKYNPARDGWITEEMSVLKRDYLPGDFRPEMISNGLDAAIAVQADQSEEETRFLLELAEQHSFIAGVVGWIDLASDKIDERLEFFSGSNKLCGFRHVVQSEPDDRFLLRPEIVRGIRSVGELDLTYDLLVFPRQLPAAIELVSRLPEQRFVLDHIAKPPIESGALAGWREDVFALAQNPNVFCKVSGMVTEASWKGWRPEHFTPYLDIVFEAFSADRLMFGSDWPVCLLAASYRQVFELVSEYVGQAPTGTQEKVFGANAIKCYGLGEATAWTCS